LWRTLKSSVKLYEYISCHRWTAWYCLTHNQLL